MTRPQRSKGLKSRWAARAAYECNATHAPQSGGTIAGGYRVNSQSIVYQTAHITDPVITDPIASAAAFVAPWSHRDHGGEKDLGLPAPLTFSCAQ
jgi:hypothetical protein